MNKMIKYKNTFKHNTNDKYEVGHTQFKVLYSRRFMAPLRKKRKNEYDANEEAR